MLAGIHPLLTGELLTHLDAMGHSDAVVVGDAHFPAARLGHRSVDVAAVSAPRLLRAIRTVVPLDDAPGLDLMWPSDGAQLPVHGELIESAGAGADDHRFVSRCAFYDLAADAYLILRTGETRVYGNALLRKGVVVPCANSGGLA